MRLPAVRNDVQFTPDELSQASERALAQLPLEGQSHNTVASYRSALRYWGSWFTIRYGTDIQFPVPVAVVLQFIIDHADRMVGDGLVRSDDGRSSTGA